MPATDGNRRRGGVPPLETGPDEGHEGPIGPYLPIARLGEGGMGDVFVATQEHPLRRTVALKVLKHGLVDRHAAARFEAERQALAVLNHPGIAGVFDAGLTADGRPFLAMEYVRGTWLTTFCDDGRLDNRGPNGPWSPRRAMPSITHTRRASSIENLKPSNILASRDGDRIAVKIIDFGIAKVLGPRLTEQSLHTAEGVVLGTPEYMSPEQAALSSVDVDARTDIHALGLVLYELVAGVPPFNRDRLRALSLLDRLRVIREEEPPRLSRRIEGLGGAAAAIAERRGTDIRSLVRRLRGELEWIVERALDKRPDRRYQSASELAADLRRFLANEPVDAAPFRPPIDCARSPQSIGRSSSVSRQGSSC